MRWTHRSERSFSESFFHVLNGWNFLYQLRPQCDPKKPFSDSTKTVLMDCSTKHKCNSVRWIHTSESNLSESFSVVIMWVYFLFHHGPLWAPKYHFAEYTTRVLETVPWRKGCNSVWWSHTSESNLSESFSLVIMWGYFLFHHGSQRAPKYHFAVSTKEC